MKTAAAPALPSLAFLVVALTFSHAMAAMAMMVLAATLAATDKIPVAGMALILGVDRFMSEARAITNLIGNGVAVVVVASWENALDKERARRALNDPKAHELRD